MKVKNKKRSNVKIELKKNLIYWNLLRFEYKFNKLFQTGVTNKRVNKTSRTSKDRKVEEINKNECLNRIIGNRKIGKSS